MRVESIVWMGVRTPAFGAMFELLDGVMNLEVTHADRGVAWFTLPGGEEIQLFDDHDEDHSFFPDGPVIGFRVADFAEAYAALSAAGIEWIGDGDQNANIRWQHFRGPDGNVYEILGPLS